MGYNNKTYADVLSEMKYFIAILLTIIILFFMWRTKESKVTEIGAIKFETSKDTLSPSEHIPNTAPQNQTTIGNIKNATIINQPTKDVRIENK